MTIARTNLLAPVLLALVLAGAGVRANAPEPIPPPADVGQPPADAVTTASGLAFKVLQPGAGGIHPTPDDLVTVHYTGWTTDGRMFDSSVARGKPVEYSLDRLMPGWVEAVQLMTAGEKRRLWLPEALAFKGKREPKGMLVFDVELISIKESPAKAPPDVGGPPSDARRTVKGIFYKVLGPGTGSQHPGPHSSVTVHYTGWTTDGKSFDSSVLRGKPATLSLGDVIPGWKEGIPMMVVGEKTRFWIPEELAYKGRSAPYGMLVFDIELISIH